MDTERTMMLMQETIDAWTEAAAGEDPHTRARLLECIADFKRAARGEA